MHFTSAIGALHMWPCHTGHLMSNALHIVLCRWISIHNSCNTVSQRVWIKQKFWQFIFNEIGTIALTSCDLPRTDRFKNLESKLAANGWTALWNFRTNQHSLWSTHQQTSPSMVLHLDDYKRQWIAPYSNGDKEILLFLQNYYFYLSAIPENMVAFLRSGRKAWSWRSRLPTQSG